MATQTYNLGDIAAPVGLFSVVLISETTGLTVPTVNTITEVGELDDVGDIEPAIQQVKTLSIKIVDDHSQHSAGFWYTALKNTVQALPT